VFPIGALVALFAAGGWWRAAPLLANLGPRVVLLAADP